MSDVVDLAKWRKLKSAIRLDVGEGRVPPRECMIFPLGKMITTLKGTFILDDKGAAEVMEKYVSHGTDLHFDYEHLSIEPEKNANPELAVAAGWFDLELRNDGLWAVNIRWTPRAEKMLRDGEYRYISPAFHADEQGYIHELLNVALTNLPATDNLNALVAASRAGADIDKVVDVKKHRAGHHQRGAAPAEAEKTRRPSKESEMKAHPLAGHLKAKMKADGSDHAAMAKSCGVSEERMKHLAAGHPPTTEEMKSCMKHLALPEEESKKLAEQHGEFLKTMEAGHDEPDGDEPDGDEGEEKKPPQKSSLDNQPSNDREVPHENKSAGGEAKVKGAKDEADEGEGDNKPPSKTTRRDDGGLSRDELIALTGSTDPREQRRKLKAMADNSNQTNADREFLKQMRAESLARAKGELVALAKAEGRWTPNWEKFFENKPNELLKEMLSSGAMPVVGGEELQPLMPSGALDGVTVLRSEQRYISMCRVLGVSDDPREYAKVKADIVSLRTNRFDDDGYPVSRGGVSLGPKMTRALMDSWMGLKPGKPNSGDKRFVTRHELRRTAKADVVGQV